MKLALSIFILLAHGVGVYAQTNSIKVVPQYSEYTAHQHQWQYQFNVADLIYLSPSFEFSYRVKPKNFIGAKISVPFLVEDYDGLYESSNNGARLEVFDKFFFSGQGTTTGNYYYFLRFGSQLSVANLNYDKTDWFEEFEDGLPYLRYDTRSFDESVIRMNISLAIGFQQVFNSFYLELYGGLTYGGPINKEDLEATQYTTNNTFEDSFSYWGSNHVLPAVGVSFGFGKPANQK